MAIGSLKRKIERVPHKSNGPSTIHHFHMIGAHNNEEVAATNSTNRRDVVGGGCAELRPGPSSFRGAAPPRAAMEGLSAHSQLP